MQLKNYGLLADKVGERRSGKQALLSFALPAGEAPSDGIRLASELPPANRIRTSAQIHKVTVRPQFLLTPSKYFLL